MPRYWRFAEGECNVIDAGEAGQLVQVVTVRRRTVEPPRILRLLRCSPAPPPPPPPQPPQVTLNVFQRARQLWKPRYHGLNSREEFKQMTRPIDSNVKTFLEAMPNRLGQGWAVTEVHEAGDGVWKKGTTVRYGSEKANSSLASLGWTAERGAKEGRPPVFVVIHKVAD